MSVDSNQSLSRRGVITKMGTGVLSATAVTLIAGRGRLALAHDTAPNVVQDTEILNGALGAELQAIAAYQVGAESGLLKKPALKLATQFQGHHKAHASALSSAIENLGGKPVTPLAKYTFPVENLKTDVDVLKFAAGLEKDAVSAYLSAVPQFIDNDLSKVAASILGDEAMHWAILLQAVGEDPVPDAFVY